MRKKDHRSKGNQRPKRTHNLVQTYARYSDLFGEPFDRSALPARISEVPLEGLPVALSQLATRALEDPDVRNHFLGYLNALDFEEQDCVRIIEALDDKLLYFPQGILSVWKWVLAYGDERLQRDGPIDQAVRTAIYLCMLVSDHLFVEGTRPDEYELTQNLAFNSGRDFRLDVVRAFYVFIHFAQDRSLYAERTYVDFNRDFHDRYGYSVEQYLAVVFGLVVYFGDHWTGQIETIFRDTSLAELARQVITDHLTFTIAEGRDWSISRVDSAWDFLLFESRPLLLLGDVLVPVSLGLLGKQVFSGLFHKLRHCYPEEDSSFLNFFGRPFEEYVKFLGVRAATDSGLPYEILPEFEYRVKGQLVRSPELVLRLGDRVLVIDAKIKRMTLGGIVAGDVSIMDRDADFLAQAILQMNNRIRELTNSPTRVVGEERVVDLTTVNEVFLVVVTMGQFPLLGSLERRFRSAVHAADPSTTATFDHFDVEEFEYFCYLLSRDTPIFRLLANKARIAPEQRLKWYLERHSLPVRRPEFLLAAMSEFTQRLRKLLFPGQE